jgi:hypothetical protein
LAQLFEAEKRVMHWENALRRDLQHGSLTGAGMFGTKSG